ncbi:hypothetical protein PROFUN_13853 [Planoprotostelium fungivorum]|uniref:Uncharacterized protein n=1 Tax=Planoprotostelium fungivorum TaxID=1890364 RepID=A0A2P6N2S6_9EUKA|nr:hypothetical protein PROFUN_13853 [Planoprotostelium fungivorum]
MFYSELLVYSFSISTSSSVTSPEFSAACRILLLILFLASAYLALCASAGQHTCLLTLGWPRCRTASLASRNKWKGRKTKTRSTGDLILEKTPKKRTHHLIVLEISSERLLKFKHQHYVSAVDPQSHHAPAPCALPPPAHVPTPSIQTTTIEGFPEHRVTHNIPVISWSWPDGMFYTLIKRSTGIAVDAFVGSDGIHVIYSWTPTEDEISQLAFDLKCHTSYLPNIVNTWKVEKVITPPVEIGNSVDIVSDIESFIVFRVPLRAANRIQLMK